jgi:hypothetical protein
VQMDASNAAVEQVAAGPAPSSPAAASPTAIARALSAKAAITVAR